MSIWRPNVWRRGYEPNPEPPKDVLDKEREEVGILWAWRERLRRRKESKDK